LIVGLLPPLLVAFVALLQQVQGVKQIHVRPLIASAAAHGIPEAEQLFGIFRPEFR
jgi:hypothetical protein